MERKNFKASINFLCGILVFWISLGMALPIEVFVSILIIFLGIVAAALFFAAAWTGYTGKDSFLDKKL